MDDDIWMPIPGYPVYEVSVYGRVRNGLTDRELKPQSNGKGVLQVKLYHRGKGKTLSVSQLMALAYEWRLKTQPEVVDFEDDDPFDSYDEDW